jgi:hypothetical protein
MFTPRLLAQYAALCFTFLVLVCGASALPFINEFSAETVGVTLDSAGTRRGVEDVNGNSSDWVELRNPDTVGRNLSGWALSDDPLAPGKWVFPGVTIASGAHLVIFASGKDRAIASVQLHTNFKLTNSGVLILSQPDGNGGWTTVHQIGTAAAAYPKQRQRFSYGYAGTTGPNGLLGYMEAQSPGALNSSVLVNSFVSDTSFSLGRGLYDTPQSVTITTATLGATLIYTADGSQPTTSNGVQVAPADASSPPSVTLPISSTTCLRARAVKVGFGATNVDTQTYIFPAKVLRQDASYVTQPFALWGHDKGDGDTLANEPDWSMDPRVVDHANAADKCVPDDLKAIPTVSVVLNWSEMFGPSGIYIAGENNRKEASLEIINPDGSKTAPNTGAIQQRGEVHIFGGTSTSRWKTDKLSMRFTFHTDLSTKVLGDDATGSYDTLVLDARLNQVFTHSQDATQRNRGDYVRDAVMSDLQNKIGGYAPHSRLVHAYINGLYWGLYTLHERPDEHFAAAYLGGSDDDYDVVKHNPSTSNFLVAGRVINPTQAVTNTNHTAGVNYQAMLNLASADLSTSVNFQALAAKLDIPDFIRYMLLNFYGGNTDWSHQNWYASYNRGRPEGKWRFHSWDAEHVFKDVSDNATALNQASTPTGIHQQLTTNAEYRLMFADAAHALLANGGLFTPGPAREAFDRRLMEINEAIRGESARWGDSGGEGGNGTELHLRFSNVVGSSTYVSWWNERLRILNTVLGGTTNNRTTVTLSQLRSRVPSLYPAVNAPVYQQHGGFVPAGFQLTITHANSSGTIYYTQDGSDPRISGAGTVSSSATAYSGPITMQSSRNIRARVLSGGNWSPLTEAYFSVNTVSAGAGNLVISKIHYRPAAPSAGEIAAGFSDRSDFEFIELLNISNQRVDLAGLSFSAGLDIRASVNGIREVGPGERALYVAKAAAFEFRYGTGFPIAGEFSIGSNLSNDGEQLTLLASNGGVIVDFSYLPAAPWPTAANGGGVSLVLIRPQINDPTVAWSWRASTGVNGAPGADDRLLYAGWKATNFSTAEVESPAISDASADPDGDGMCNMFEYFMGTNPKLASVTRLPTTFKTLPGGVSGSQIYPTFSFRHVKAAEDCSYRAETSADFSAWSGDAVVLLGAPLDHGDGTETRTYRSIKSVDQESERFFRLRVQRP